jgi:hypothetical protein
VTYLGWNQSNKVSEICEHFAILKSGTDHKVKIMLGIPSTKQVDRGLTWLMLPTCYLLNSWLFDRLKYHHNGNFLKLTISLTEINEFVGKRTIKLTMVRLLLICEELTYKYLTSFLSKCQTQCWTTPYLDSWNLLEEKW